MIQNAAAVLLLHPDDRTTGEEVRRALLTMNRHLDIELRNALPPWHGLRSDGSLLLLATRNLRSSPKYGELTDALGPAAREGRLMVLTRRVDFFHPELRSQDIVDLADWDMAPLPDEVRRIAEWIMNHRSLDRRWSDEHEITPEMLGPVAGLDVSPRTLALLQNDNMIYVGDLVIRTEAELLRLPNFGRTALKDVKDALDAIGLRPGMELVGWPPENIGEALQRLEMAERVSRLRQAKGGPTFEPRDDRFAMVTETDPDDRAAALRPMNVQMQTAVLDKARNFVGFARRLDNQPGWTGIGRTASMLVDLLDRAPEDVPDVLGLLYPTAIELGSYVELDQQLSAGTESYAAPLDPEMRRPLGDLVRTLAPWLRAFPSVRDADDEASRFLVDAAALKPVFEVVSSAERFSLIAGPDLDVLRQLEHAAERGAFQGAKAGGRIKRTTTNLVIGAAAFAGSFMVQAISSDYATTSPLAHKVGQFLTHAEAAITDLVADAAPDLRHAIRGMVEEFGGGGSAMPVGSSPPRPTPTPKGVGGREA